MVGGKLFDREALLASFDRIGRVASGRGTILEIVVYGGSALMLASNFRIATEDVDIAEIGSPWPDWLSSEVACGLRSSPTSTRQLPCSAVSSRISA